MNTWLNRTKPLLQLVQGLNLANDLRGPHDWTPCLQSVNVWLANNQSDAWTGADLLFFGSGRKSLKPVNTLHIIPRVNLPSTKLN